MHIKGGGNINHSVSTPQRQSYTSASRDGSFTAKERSPGGTFNLGRSDTVPSFIKSDNSSFLITSPASQNKRYNRQKYYSALKTGFRHINATDNVAQSFLMENKPLPMLLPFIGGQDNQEEGTMSSTVIIFSCWNTMAGSAIVSLPWAF